MAGALDGVRIVDLTTVVMGPLATRMLGDHGADVIRVVGPDTAVEDPADDTGVGGISLDVHRNKRCVMLDLKSEHGRAAMHELLATADVFITNLRRGAVERLGLDADTLRARHPGLIHCVANGFDSSGPLGDQAAYDDAIQAASGLADLFGRIDGEPRYAPTIVSDKVCALFIVQALMAALLHRERTGDGQTIQVPMFESMIAFMTTEHVRGAARVPPAGPIGYPRLLTPNRRPYRCKDGFVALLPYTDKHWHSFFDAIDRMDVLDDERFVDHVARVRHADELYGVLAELAPLHTVEEWLAICDERSIPASPVNALADLFDHPQVDASGLVVDHEHPTAGPYRAVRHPVTYDTMDTSIRRPAPEHGEHTAEVFRSLGWTDEQIADLS